MSKLKNIEIQKNNKSKQNKIAYGCNSISIKDKRDENVTPLKSLVYTQRKNIFYAERVFVSLMYAGNFVLYTEIFYLLNFA